jgi:hypothetical protein
VYLGQDAQDLAKEGTFQSPLSSTYSSEDRPVFGLGAEANIRFYIRARKNHGKKRRVGIHEHAWKAAIHEFPVPIAFFWSLTARIKEVQVGGVCS